jgi:hypothetical protein
MASDLERLGLDEYAIAESLCAGVAVDLDDV